MPTYTENQMCHECGRLNCIIPKILISLNLTCEMLENLTQLSTNQFSRHCNKYNSNYCKCILNMYFDVAYKFFLFNFNVICSFNDENLMKLLCEFWVVNVNTYNTMQQNDRIRTYKQIIIQICCYTTLTIFSSNNFKLAFVL